MELLLHTIALEPARWTPQRVSIPLETWLPHLARAGIFCLEIFEPHLTSASDEHALVRQMARLGLAPMILSTYLDLSPSSNHKTAFRAQADALLLRVDRFGFRKVRLFPGRSASADELDDTVAQIAGRLRLLADLRPDVEFLVETHDGSLADEPTCVVRLIEACARPNVGLLWQPTVFEPTAARRQFHEQKSLVCHFHLQNRAPDGSFAKLREGIIPWAKILAEVGFSRGMTLEFVPSGICPLESFDFETSLQEVSDEFAYIRQIAGDHTGQLS